MHSPCSHALECRWGSRTVPGTCGFANCLRDRYFREARNNKDIFAIDILRDAGEISEHGYINHPDGTFTRY